MIWEKEESLSRDNLGNLQISRLKATVKRVYEKVPIYRNKMMDAGIRPDDIKSLEDLRYLPFSDKNDLRETYPYGMFCEDKKNIVRIHASSGTTGKSIIVGYTENDIETWKNLIARLFYATETNENDTIQNAFGYGLFTGGMGIHYGAEKIKARVIPISGGNTKKQIDLMVDLGTTVIAGTPSYLLHIAEEIEKNTTSRNKLKLKTAIVGAEPCSEELRLRIETILNVQAFDNYGLSEVMGPGVSYECKYKNGLHISEDHFIPEIIDPETLEVKEEGKTGELILTSITKEAFPVIRYRTRDITSLSYEKCECGRTFVRMARCENRTDDMLIIRGVNLFPSQIEVALLQLNLTSPHFEIHVLKENAMDKLMIKVERKSDIINDKKKLVGTIKKYIKNATGLSIDLDLVEPNTLKRYSGKGKKVFDHRKTKNSNSKIQDVVKMKI